MINLKKFLKMQLWKWKNKEYWEWQSSHRIVGHEWHHLLKRQNSDLFVVNIPVGLHKRIESQGYKEGEFEELFIQAVLNIERFIDSKTKNI